MSMAQNTAPTEPLDVAGLQGKREKIKELMRRDPRFIARLITVCARWPCLGSAAYDMHAYRCAWRRWRFDPTLKNTIYYLSQSLDAEMHKQLREKQRRAEEVCADSEALAQIDSTIASHIAPALARLEADISKKSELRKELTAQLEGDTMRMASLEREAAALLDRARHATSKLQARTASAALQNARGYSATVSTTELVRARPAKPGQARGSSTLGGARRSRAADSVPSYHPPTRAR
jgi:hypothetical protein